MSPDDHEQPAETEADPAAEVRRLVSWVIIAGLALGFAAAAFLVWEAWSANKAALEDNQRSEDATVVDLANSVNGAAPPVPDPSAGQSVEAGLPAE